MTINVHLVGDCTLRLWGLTPRQRLERLLRGFPEARLVDQGQPLPASGEVLLLRADYAYDERVMRGLMKATGIALQDTRDGTVVAARGDAGR
ncbi:MAG TPA: CDP-alcohol phosphatidyltransferase family protein, partial [Methyloversatilis sp.]